MATMNPLPPDPYKALGVGKEADTSAIKTAYRKLVLKCHPDKVIDPAQKAIKQDEFQRVQQAYEILSDDSKRREYDNEVNLKKLRDEFHKAMPHHSSTRPPPKNYYEYNMRTAEPPPSFRPGPPPAAAPRSPYPGNPQFSASWEHEMPSRSKHIYDEERKPRRTASHENPRKDEDSKEERRRREKKEAEAASRREKEREEREKRRADRERRDREERKEQEKRDRAREEKERARREEERRVKKEREKERERREKERDQLRQRQQDQKSESKKPIYVEHHEESGEEDRRVPKKKTSSSENKKQAHDSPRRAKSSGRPGSGDDLAKEKWDSNLRTAAEYMRVSRRKGSGSGPSAAYYPDGGNNFSENFPDPDAWHAEKPSRSRRPSHDDKKYRATVEEDEPEDLDASLKGPPPLRKAFTSPAGGMHNMANSSAPRVPHLSRAHTMQPDLRVPPTAPPAPSPEASRHSKSERRPRRASFDAEYDDEPRRSRATRPNVVRYKVDEEDIHPRVQSHYRPTEEAYYSSPASGGGAKFGKVKVASYDKPLYQAKHYEHEDVSFTPMESPYRSSGGGYNNYGYVHAG